MLGRIALFLALLPWLCLAVLEIAPPPHGTPSMVLCELPLVYGPPIALALSGWAATRKGPKKIANVALVVSAINVCLWLSYIVWAALISENCPGPGGTIHGGV